MKSIKILALGVAAMCSLGTQAANPKKKAKKEAEPVAVVDTVSMDVFSFHFGRANTNGLKSYLAQRMGIDVKYMDDFMKGFEQKEMSEDDKRQQARLAGIEIRQQVETQIIPQASAQINDSIDLLNHKAFVEGFRIGVMEEDVPGVSMDSTQTLVRKQMDYYHTAQMERKYGANRKAGEDFLAKNAKESGVKVTESGLQYKVLTKGTGEIPTADQKVKVHYRGTLLDGTEFDSSYKRNEPAVFGCNQVIKGWTEALTMMPVGSKWMLYIPYDLAYGDRETGSITPFSMLTFEVELLEIVK